MLKFVAGLLLALVGASYASAQFYEVEFEGGEAAWTLEGPGGGDRTATISATSTPVSGGGRRYEGRLVAGKSSASESCPQAAAHGPLTAVLRWNGGPQNEPPPPFFLIDESVNVLTSGTSGQADCGLPGATNTTDVRQWRSFGTRRMQHPGKEEIVLECDPSGAAVDTFQGAIDGKKASVDVRWQIYVIVPTLRVYGATLRNGQYSASVGQKLRVEFTLSGGNTVQDDGASYRWDVNGGDPFDSWEVLSGQNRSVFRPFDKNAFVGKGVLVVSFKNRDENLLVSWTGDPFGKGEFELQTKINIIEPQHSETTRIGTMQFLHRDPGDPNTVPATPPSVTTEPANAPSNWPRNAWQLFGASLKVPDPTPEDPEQVRLYRAGTVQAARVWRDGASGNVGSYSHLQLVQDDGKYNGQFTGDTHGQYALDNKYPYAGTRIEGSSSSTTPLVFLDAPGIDGLDDDQTFPFGQAHTFNQDQKFKLYVMYRPPSPGTGTTSDVPLALLEWSVGTGVYATFARTAQNPYAWKLSGTPAPASAPGAATRPAYFTWSVRKPAQ